MPKQRKTKEQKKAIQQKREEVKLNQFVYSLNQFSGTPKQIHSTIAHSYSSYAYVISDLRRTLIVCSAIIAVQLFLLFFLKHRMVLIPGVSY